MSPNYKKLYHRYKARCQKLSAEKNILQEKIERCQKILFNGAAEGEVKPESCGSLSSVETSSIYTSTPRRLTFSENEDASNAEDFEPGSNKWDCLNDEERLMYLHHKTPPSPCRQEDKQDKNEAFYIADNAGKKKNINADMGLLDDTPNRERNVGGSKLQQTPKRLRMQRTTPSPADQQSSDNDTTHYEANSNEKNAESDGLTASLNVSSGSGKKDRKKSKRHQAVLPEKHICKLPYCKEHQPVFVSSIRKIKLLSPCSRRLATNRRGKSPKGLWSLEMPSTQEIRNRNQTQD